MTRVDVEAGVRAGINAAKNSIPGECDSDCWLLVDALDPAAIAASVPSPPADERDARITGLEAALADEADENQRLRAELDRMNAIFCPPGQPGPVEALEAAEEEIARLRNYVDILQQQWAENAPAVHYKKEAEKLRAELEQALSTIDGAANMLRGMSMDRRLHQDARDAAIARATELDEFVERMQT